MEKTPKPRKIINREISWLSFNGRVLQEAADPTVPLIERIRFLGIFSNNRDEFFRVRVAIVRRMIEIQKSIKKKETNVKPKKLLKWIQAITISQYEKFEQTYAAIVEDLKKENIFILNETEVSDEQGEFIKEFFYNQVRTAMVPIMVSNLDKFPYLKGQVHLPGGETFLPRRG